MISLTTEAASRIKELFNSKEMPLNSAIRFAVKGGGCSGFKMEVDIEPPRKYDMAGRHDLKFVSDDVRILVDKKSYLFLDGTVVDWTKTNFGHSFSYQNPNIASECGCGLSFSV